MMSRFQVMQSVRVKVDPGSDEKHAGYVVSLPGDEDALVGVRIDETGEVHQFAPDQIEVL